jgi:nucleoside-diphosphate-sugar epimerase
LGNEKKIKPLTELYPTAQKNLELVKADLLQPDSWTSAVGGCEYVIHVASPFPSIEPADPQEIIRPAVEGTLAVLRAAHASGSVKRVVLTSSGVAIMGEGSPNGEPLNEEHWTKPDDDVTSYFKSKTLAEKAAWDFVKEHPSLELTVMNPGLVTGPMLHDSECTSGEVIIRMLQFQMPMIPDVWTTGVDVRDVAEAHVKAMILPEAAGQRFGLGTRLVSWVEIAEILKEEFGPQGYWISTMKAPYFGVWIYSFVDKGAKMMLRDIGRKYNLDGTKMRKILGINPIDIRKSVIDAAYSVIERGFVKKTAGYKGPDGSH